MLRDDEGMGDDDDDAGVDVAVVLVLPRRYCGPAAAGRQDGQAAVEVPTCTPH